MEPLASVMARRSQHATNRKTQDKYSRWLWRRCAYNTVPCIGWGKQHLEKMTELDISKPQGLGNWISQVRQWCSSCHSNKGRLKRILRSSLTSCQASAEGVARANEDDWLRQQQHCAPAHSHIKNYLFPSLSDKRKESKRLTISNLRGNGLSLWPWGILKKSFRQLCPAER